MAKGGVVGFVRTCVDDKVGCILPPTQATSPVAGSGVLVFWKWVAGENLDNNYALVNVV